MKRGGHWPAGEFDWVQVERVINGGPPTGLSRSERDEVIRRLNAAGLSDPQVAQRVAITPRTVLRVRNRLDIPAAGPWAMCRSAPRNDGRGEI